MTTDSNTILIVDDNPDILKMLSQALVLAGYAVRTAYDGPSALAEAQQHPVDLILLDIAMPEMDGFAVCRQLKQMAPTQDIPIIFMTAMSDVVDEVKGFQLGAVDYITKPFQFETVKARIHTHLTLQHLQNRLAQKNWRLQEEIAEREKTAKNLRLTQFSVDNAADAIFWIGPEARISFVNFTACELLEYSTEELLSMSWYDLDANYTPEVWPGHWQRVQQHPLTIESRHRKKDGQVIPVEVTFTYINFEDHHYHVAFVRDVTWRRWATEELFASENRYRSLFEDAPIALGEADLSRIKAHLHHLSQAGITDLKSYLAGQPGVLGTVLEAIKILDVNQTALELFEAETKGEFLSKVASILTWPLYATFYRLLLALGEGDQAFTEETVVRTLSGDCRHVALKLSPASDHHESWDKVLISVVDITERKQAEAALQKAHDELSRRVDELTTFNLITQTLSAVTDLGTGLEIVAGTTARLFAGHSTMVLLFDEDLSTLTVAAYVNRSGPELQKRNRQFPRWNGLVGQRLFEQRRSLVVSQPHLTQLLVDAPDLVEVDKVRHMMIVPLQARGDVIGLLVITLNQPERQFTSAEIELAETIAGQMAVTIENGRLFEQQQEQRRLAESRSQELDAFARTVAHDLKNPLGVIVTYADFMTTYAANLNPESMAEKIQVIRQYGLKGTNIVDELLLLAGVRKQSVPLAVLDMDRIVYQAEHRISFLRDEYKGQIVIPASWPAAVGYGPWVEEVWINYLSNGLKYSGQPPHLKLGATPQPDGTVRFWVRDNGPGLPPEKQAVLFTEFTRLDEVRAKGHGLGLSIVRRIVEKLGGTVGVKSAMGQGSEFYFTLPAGNGVGQPPPGK
ncbi:MAG: response regulator [Anaerolineae bacterium]|nr:response regulator [Anaerolineae bacterium]